MNLLSTLSQKEKEKLLIKRYTANQIIFKEGEHANYVGILVSGAINIESYSKEGGLIIYNVIYPGEMFGNNLIFSKQQTYLGDVKAKLASEVALINKEDLLSLLQGNKEFLTSYLAKNAEFSKALNGQVKILSVNNAKERILLYLHQHQNSIKIISVAHFATSIGLSREATSRMLSELVKQKKIKREGNILSLYEA